jgi:hypothetical protein
MGRPRKNPGELRVPLPLRVDADVRVWVGEYARLHGLKVSEAAEVLLVKLTRRYTPHDAPKP